MRAASGPALGWIVACLRHPQRVVALCLLLTAGWSLALPRLRLATDGRDLFAPEHPAVRFQDEVDRRFATGDFVVVAVSAEGDRDLFSAPALGLLLRLSERFTALPGVSGSEVRSLATEFAPHWSDGTLRLDPPLTAAVTDPDQIAAVAERARSEPLFHRVLLADDERGSAIYVPLEATGDRPRLFHQIRDVVEAEWRGLPAADRQGYRVHLLGPAASESLLGEHVLEDLALLLPLALAVVALVLGLWFRQIGIVLVGLGEASVVVVWAMGLLGALGKGVSLVTAVMPVILATYCVADTIHIGQRFLDKRAEMESPHAAMAAALGELLQPVVFTSLTTAAGFLAFAVSPIPPLRDFGLFTAFGILCALGTSVLVVPSALLLTGFGSKRRRPGASPAVARRLRALGRLGVGAPVAVVGVALLLSALVGMGAARLEIQDSWVDNFSPESALVRSDHWFNRGFAGSNVLNVLVETGEPEAIWEPAFLSELERLQEQLVGRQAVGGGLSLVDQLRAVARTLEGEDRLPASFGEAREWGLLFEMAGGSRSLDAYLDDDASAINLWLFLNRADYRKTRDTVREAESFQWRQPDGAPPVSLRFAGDAYLSYLLVDSIARSQRGSLLAALAVTLAVVGWMLRSLAASLLAVLPVGVAVLWNFGAMGWWGLPLGVATSTFSAIALGIGVDFALHWIASLRLALDRGATWEGALQASSDTTGVAILLHAGVLMLGFGVLVFSRVPPNQRLGLILCLNLAVCLVATLVLLPAAATLARRLRAGGRLLEGRPLPMEH